MIVIGYQGIGKSTLAQRCPQCVDLESGNFWVGDERVSDWHILYCQIALHLSSQGKVVFISSHKVVRDYLMSLPTSERIVAVVPGLRLKEPWIEKLKQRYDDSQLDKDYKAWRNAVERYSDNIIEIMSDINDTIVINDMDYSLQQLVLPLDYTVNFCDELDIAHTALELACIDKAKSCVDIRESNDALLQKVEEFRQEYLNKSRMI